MKIGIDFPRLSGRVVFTVFFGLEQWSVFTSAIAASAL
jgi:hypothetical protein